MHIIEKKITTLMHMIKLISLVVFVFGFIDTVNGQSVVCPAVRTSSGWLDLFPLPCKKHSECRVMGTQHLCCKGFCTKGVQGAAAQKIRANGASQNSVQSSSTSTSSTTTTTTSTTTTTTTTTTPSTTTTSSTTTTPKPKTTEPPRPFLQLLPIQRTPAAAQKTNAAVKTGKSQKLVCPKAGQAPVLLFPIPCENNAQCRASSGPGQVCCDNRCVKGIPAPRPTSAPKTHQPILGVIPRECPSAPLGELLFEVQSCKTDADCWPRVCCPDGTRSYCRTAKARLDLVPVARQIDALQSCKTDADCWPRVCCPDGTRSYCRTAKARLDLVPVARQIDAPVRMLEQYLQCTAPPQYDLFPKKCSSSVDCFPNLCCAEGGKKHCRPPQRSLLGLLAGVTQTIGSTLGNIRQNQAQANKNKV